MEMSLKNPKKQKAFRKSVFQILYFFEANVCMFFSWIFKVTMSRKFITVK